MTQTEIFKTELECGGYSAGHPWYYLLGGKRPTLKQISAYAERFEKRGYRAEEIDAAHRLPEPKRTQVLLKIRAEIMEGLRRDMSGYREAVRNLSAYRKNHQPEASPKICDDAHVAMSLKFSHLLNDFIHLQKLDSVPSQLDLF
ncbi:hypothetical protein [Pseudovibrio exalbescens]|uniref:Uncharacterized protein n=1 Tax=Pseudovibrio exalbescens TaxID=197461 RepID=A0A1U7JDZ8_9HYPH|nr:hypothetical protein [Pseudovibrio exalbescens]OKL42914.1 hypothetical protein A3843_16280 [Pseudovibrio exalbescens]